MNRVVRLAVALLALGATFAVRPVAAQNYPTRPVKMMVGFSPGGTIDVTARIIADQLGQKLGKPFIVENRTGANGQLAAEAVAKAEPDGQTIFVSNSSSITLNPTLFKKLPYDPERDFAPVTTVVATPLILVVNADDPKSKDIKTVKDLVAAAKGKPGEISYGSAGNGNITHLAFELLSQRAEIQMLHVPYRGAAAAEVAALSQEVIAVFDTLSAIPYIKAGKFRAIAVSSPTRLPALPDVPTIAESGYPGFDITFWVGIFVPKKTPSSIVDLLQKTIVSATQDPAVQSRLEPQGLISTLTPSEFADKIRTETKQLADVAAAAHLEPN
ncbi:Bug family tripartite tricarboxylate transporter substrate binding protein [Bradyrhizobium iriomotense]|uniref:Bug family tripartite tricarboxylate transporter substrate binding protein n=1 Tax=Bradyrhizobium iriomotense TaxID=441950 RepID=UPI001B8A87C8|nr:tripartite tricarboxylate transporter substrate binding protein [Bradyrhizobium iriomotense]MBR0781911.1 tripartite tricarboxylate transporter substrate binding protein [Bradyrhizobium iriomotense]